MRTLNARFTSVLLGTVVAVSCSVDDKSGRRFGESDGGSGGDSVGGRSGGQGGGGKSGGTDGRGNGGDAGTDDGGAAGAVPTSGGRGNTAGSPTAGSGANSQGGDVADAGAGGTSDSGAGASDGTGGSAGKSGAGGTAGKGGAPGTGGTAGKGGAPGTGGTAGKGGTPGAGGTPGTGGTASKGGTPGAGGAPGKGGTAGGGGTGGASSWCATQPVPAGVVAADYQCVDFESGLPPANIWKGATTPNQGTATLTTARATSPMYSLEADVRADDMSALADRANFTWSVVGSTPITGVSLSAAVNPTTFAGVSPPWTGYIELLCVRFGAGETCLNYTRGATTQFASDYTGYFVSHYYASGAVQYVECEVTPPPPANIWTRIELQVVPSATLPIQLLMNGLRTTPTDCIGNNDADTAAQFRFGLAVSVATTTGWVVYYDNVRASVTR